MPPKYSREILNDPQFQMASDQEKAEVLKNLAPEEAVAKAFPFKERPRTLPEQAAFGLLSPFGLTGGATEEATAGGLGVLLPETASGAAGLATSLGTFFGPTGRTVSKMNPMLQALTRILGPSAVTFGTAKAAGEPAPLESALTTGAPLALSEMAFPGLRWLKNIGPQIERRSATIAQGKIDAQNLVTAIGKEVPVLAKVPKEASSLVALRAPEVGRAKLSKLFEQADEAARREFGELEVKFPVKVEVTGGTKILNLPMTIDKAQEALKLSKALARDAEPGAVGRFLREEARQAEETYRGILQAKNPALVRAYDSAVTQFDKGLDMLDLLRDLVKVGALEPGEKASFLNTSRLAKFLMQPGMVEKYSPLKFPELWKMVTRQKPGEILSEVLGRGDIIQKLLGGERAFGRLPTTTGGVAVTLPPISRVKRAGEFFPSPFAVTGPQKALQPLGLRGFQEMTGE